MVRYRAYIDEQGRWWQEESLDGTDYKKRVEVKYTLAQATTRAHILAKEVIPPDAAHLVHQEKTGYGSATKANFIML